MISGVSEKLHQVDMDWIVITISTFVIDCVSLRIFEMLLPQFFLIFKEGPIAVYAGLMLAVGSLTASLALYHFARAIEYHITRVIHKFRSLL